jgi:NADPH:quinone reductase-like Zn-dependent oxidoreductase
VVAAKLTWRRQKVVQLPMVKANPSDLEAMKELIEAGKITPVIDRAYPLSDAAEAIRYVEAGHARGKVVITV